MQLYKVRLKAKSWLSSQWQADTIWGHLCWGLKYLYGEQKLSDFIQAYITSQPPLLLSNGFPDDLLPRPTLPYPPSKEREEFKRQKDAKKVDYLTEEEFCRALRGETFYPSPKHSIKSRVTLKNQINRITGTTGEEGNLYSFEEYHYEFITIYLKITEGWEDITQALFKYIAETGYGKRKSVGYGWLEMLDFQSFSGFASPREANAFVSLSNFVPAAHDPTQGYWKVLIKYGKLGEEYANSVNPFKKPLIMFSAGSVFYDSPIRDYYGRLVHELSSAYSEVAQYGFALPVPLKLEG